MPSRLNAVGPRRMAMWSAGVLLHAGPWSGGAVVEVGHTLLLGWSSSTPSLICEIVEANSSQDIVNGHRGVIVILARTEIGIDQKKRKDVIEQMEDQQIQQVDLRI